MEPTSPKPEEASSLEASTTAPATPEENTGIQASESLEPTEFTSSATTAGDPSADKKPADKASKPKGIRSKFAKLNIYLLLFILVVVIAVMALIIGIQKSSKNATPTELTSQTLSTDAVNQLKGNDVKIGDAQQTLNVESNAVFAGKVLVQGSADIAGALKVAGTLSITTLAVSGTGSFEQAQINNLAVSGGASVQGQLTIQKTINVTGGGSFGGPITAPQLTVDTLTLSKDLQLNGHIDAGGNTPSRTNGSALGSGGTSSVSGTDTAGTVTISTGGSPPAGCFVTINFVQKFNATPHVVATPTSSDSAGLAYYLSKNTAGFSICSNAPVASKNYTFDYIVID